MPGLPSWTVTGISWPHPPSSPLSTAALHKKQITERLLLQPLHGILNMFGVEAGLSLTFRLSRSSRSSLTSSLTQDLYILHVGLVALENPTQHAAIPGPLHLPFPPSRVFSPFRPFPGGFLPPSSSSHHLPLS